MSSLLATARFLMQTAGVGGPAPSPRPIQVDGGDGWLPAFEFAPSRPRGTILFVHGMTLRGPEDPRQVAACQGLARAGFRVVAPRFPAIAQARIDPRSIDRIAAVIQSLGPAPIGIFSASFSASLCLIAASRPTLQPRVAAICAIGAYADVQDCLSFVMCDPSADPYGRLVVFASLLDRAVGECAAVQAALFEAVADESYRRAERRLPAAREALGPSDRQLLDRVLHDASARDALCREILAASPELLARLDVLPCASSIRSPVALIHGEGDTVIPARHSRMLHRARTTRQLPGAMAITPLIDHGDTQWSARSLAGLPALAGTLRGFLAACTPQG